MSETIQWPEGEFTIEAAVQLNAPLAEGLVRKKLSAEISAKRIVQTQKGDHKQKGKFQLVK